MMTLINPQDIPPVIVIAGPTASGKNDLALDLAKEFGGIIINADSRQVYKELKIGAAQPIPDKVIKPGWWQIDGVDHFMYGYVETEDEYSLYKFRHDLLETINNHAQKNQPIFLVGGTGLYIDSFVFNYDLSSDETPAHDKFQNLTVRELQAKLSPSDLAQLNESDRNNPHRLIRAIIRGTTHKKGATLKHLYLFLDLPRSQLYNRINERTEKMFENGLLQEVESLRGDLDKKSLNSIGYREFKEYFDGSSTLEEVKSKIAQHSRNYAKRQTTWFKRNPLINHVSSTKQAQSLVKNFLVS